MAAPTSSGEIRIRAEGLLDLLLVPEEHARVLQAIRLMGVGSDAKRVEQALVGLVVERDLDASALAGLLESLLEEFSEVERLQQMMEDEDPRAADSGT